MHEELYEELVEYLSSLNFSPAKAFEKLNTAVKTQHKKKKRIKLHLVAGEPFDDYISSVLEDKSNAFELLEHADYDMNLKDTWLVWVERLTNPVKRMKRKNYEKEQATYEDARTSLTLTPPVFGRPWPAELRADGMKLDASGRSALTLSPFKPKKKVASAKQQHHTGVQATPWRISRDVQWAQQTKVGAQRPKSLNFTAATAAIGFAATMDDGAQQGGAQPPVDPDGLCSIPE
jgi:hypothetical protein